MLGLVEPDQAQRLVLGHAVEQVLDLGERARLRAHRGLRQQHRLAREGPDLADGPAEDGGESVAGTVVVAVDADPRDVPGAWPPVLDRAGARLVRLERPQPGDALGALVAEERPAVPPRGHEGAGRGVTVTPGVPRGVHLVPEPDDHGVAEVADAVG